MFPGETGPGSAAAPGRPGPESVPVALDSPRLEVEAGEQHSAAHLPEPGGGTRPGPRERQEEAALLLLQAGAAMSLEPAPGSGMS